MFAMHFGLVALSLQARESFDVDMARYSKFIADDDEEVITCKKMVDTAVLQVRLTKLEFLLGKVLVKATTAPRPTRLFLKPQPEG